MQGAKLVERAQLCAQAPCDSLQALEVICPGLRDAGFELQSGFDRPFETVELLDLFGEGLKCLSGFGSCLVVLKESRDKMQRQLLIGRLKEFLEYDQLLTAELQ